MSSCAGRRQELGDHSPAGGPALGGPVLPQVHIAATDGAVMALEPSIDITGLETCLLGVGGEDWSGRWGEPSTSLASAPEP